LFANRTFALTSLPSLAHDRDGTVYFFGLCRAYSAKSSFVLCKKAIVGILCIHGVDYGGRAIRSPLFTNI
jgi:hypothetical protein